MKKLLKEVLFLAAGMMLCFTSCSNGSDDPARPTPNVNSNGTGVITASAGLKFDFSGAKALAAVDAGALTQGADEGSTADSPLIKFLEDGSAVAAVTKTGSGNLSKIKKIYKSPVASSKDVFVVFENQSWLNGFTLGTFVCVHEDGSIADILKKTENTNNGNNYYSLYNNGNNVDIKFDGAGNAYFMRTDNNYTAMPSRTICKYIPSNNTIIELTASANGVNYSNFIITSDSQLIIASGSSGGGAFLRSIPISDPNHPTNIYYNSNGGGVSWEYDDANGICYFSAEGFYRSVRNGNTFSEAIALGSPLHWSSPIDSKYKSENGTQIQYYVWKEKFLNSNNSVNSNLVLKYMFNRCFTSGEKEFRLDYFKNNQKYSALYSELKDTNAIDYIAESSERMKLFYEYFRDFYNEIENEAGSLQNLVFKKASLETAYKNISENGVYVDYKWDGIYFYLDQNYFTNNEGLWKTCSNSSNGTNAFYLVHVVDAAGYPIWEARKIALPNGKMVSSQLYNGNIYMSYALLTSSGAETGFHQIYSVNLDTGDYKNLFQNVPNNSMLEVISYSVGSDLLYYSAVRGTAVENGVVNVTSGEYNPLTIKKKLTAIYTF